MDHVLNFGSHKGKKLSELADDYLQWMARPGKKNSSGEPFSLSGRQFKNVDWEALARVELTRRKGGGAVTSPDHVNLDGGTSDGRSPADAEPDLAQAAVLGPIQISSNDEFRPTYDAVDMLLSTMIREYIIRLNKDQLFISWAEDLCREVIRRGVKVSSSASFEQAYTYVGYEFTFVKSTSKPTVSLLSVKKVEIA
jgi:hypothetical protein